MLELLAILAVAFILHNLFNHKKQQTPPISASLERNDALQERDTEMELYNAITDNENDTYKQKLLIAALSMGKDEAIANETHSTIKAQIHLEYARTLLNALDAPIDADTHSLLTQMIYHNVMDALELDAACEIQSTCDCVASSLLYDENDMLVAYMLYNDMAKEVSRMPWQTCHIIESINSEYLGITPDLLEDAVPTMLFMSLSLKLMNNLPDNIKNPTYIADIEETQELLDTCLRLHRGLEIKTTLDKVDQLRKQYKADRPQANATGQTSTDAIQPTLQHIDVQKVDVKKTEQIQSKPQPILQKTSAKTTAEPPKTQEAAQSAQQPSAPTMATRASEPARPAAATNVTTDANPLQQHEQSSTVPGPISEDTAVSARDFQTAAKEQAEAFRRQMQEQAARTSGHSTVKTDQENTAGRTNTVNPMPTRPMSQSKPAQQELPTAKDYIGETKENSTKQYPAGYVPIGRKPIDHQ